MVRFSAQDANLISVAQGRALINVFFWQTADVKNDILITK